jgi:hypothetical protein
MEDELTSQELSNNKRETTLYVFSKRFPEVRIAPYKNYRVRIGRSRHDISQPSDMPPSYYAICYVGTVVRRLLVVACGWYVGTSVKSNGPFFPHANKR